MNTELKELFAKYDVPAPRYTSRSDSVSSNSSWEIVFFSINWRARMSWRDIRSNLA